jgi:LysR family pca operon transcriptional activator
LCHLDNQKGNNVDRRLKFRHRDAFSAIARTRSFKFAAKVIHLTQPAISKLLKELEIIMGVALINAMQIGCGPYARR